MRLTLPFLILTLSACSNRGAVEEEKYRMVERQTATYIEKYRYKELCMQGKAVSNAYLEDRNEAKYRDWKSKADTNCELASLL